MLMHLGLELGLIAVAELLEQPLEVERARHLAPLLLVTHVGLVHLTAVGEDGGELQLTDQILEGLGAEEHGEKVGRIDHGRGVKGGLARRVVLGAHLLVGENLVRLTHLLELGVRVRVARVLVRMQLPGLDEVRLADDGGARAALDAQDVVQLRLLDLPAAGRGRLLVARSLDPVPLAVLVLTEREDLPGLLIQVEDDPLARVLVPDLARVALRERLGRVPHSTSELHRTDDHAGHRQCDRACDAGREPAKETLDTVLARADDGRRD